MLPLQDEVPPQRPPDSPAMDAGGAGDWYVVHTKSNLEWRLAKDLLRLGVDYYLPQCERVTRAADRRRTVSVLPLFKNYLFVRGDENTPSSVYATLKVRGVIRVVNQKRLGGDLANLERAIERNPRIEQCDVPVKGQRVKISEGPFEGVEGIVISRGKDTLLVLEIKDVAFRATMEIDAARVEAA